MCSAIVATTSAALCSLVVEKRAHTLQPKLFFSFLLRIEEKKKKKKKQGPSSSHILYRTSTRPYITGLLGCLTVETDSYLFQSRGLVQLARQLLEEAGSHVEENNKKIQPT